MNATQAERWLPIPSYEGHYEVSDRGGIRSLDRVIYEPPSAVRRNGRHIKRRGKTLSPVTRESGHLWIRLPDRTHPVHRLVYMAFVGPIPEGLLVRHLNDIPTDNRIENLAVGTHSDNRHDAVRNGIHPMAVKTHCLEGHPYTPENTYIHPSRHDRRCRTCIREKGKAYVAKNKDAVRGYKRSYKERQRALRSGV